MRMPRSKSRSSSSPKKSSAESDLDADTPWARIIDSITRGDRFPRPFVSLGSTPAILKSVGLIPADLVMAQGKVARCRREHPEVGRDIWHRLPLLLTDPLAAFPSRRRDGSLVVVLVVPDAAGDPVIVAIQPDMNVERNVVLSVYGKTRGIDWATRQIADAKRDGLPHYVRGDFAATMPQPGSAEAIPSSSGPIPADGTAKPKRQILSVRKNSTNS